MKTYDVAYVPNNYTIPMPEPQDINSLDLKTITRTYLCGKSHGKVSECMKCPKQCPYGKRALELLNPVSIKPSNTIPLFNGKTMLEKAREEVAKQKGEPVSTVEPPKTTAKPKKNANGRAIKEGWYEEAYYSSDPLQWIMDTFGLTKAKARRKVYLYQYNHPELKESMPLWESSDKKQKPAEKPVEAKPEKTVETKSEKVEPEEVLKEPEQPKNDALLTPLEEKINSLMNLQQEYKEKAEHYQNLYKEITGKVEALYEALRILNNE